MASKEKKKNTALLQFVLVVASMALMVDLAIYPAANAIYEAFPNENIAVVNFIITGPSLTIIVGSIIAGVLARYISKKTMLVIAYVVFCFTTILGGAVDNVLYLVVTRGITGVAVGFISTLVAALIAELFVDEKTRSRVMGFYTGGMSLIGSIMALVAGQLAAGDWHSVFYVYVIAVPITIAVICVVPKTPPEGTPDTTETIDEAEMEPVPGGRSLGRSVALSVAAFVFNALYAVVLTMIAVYLAEQSLGGEAVAGTLNSVTTLGSMVACLLFGFIYIRTRRATPVWFAVFMAVGFGILGAIFFLPATGVACFLIGATYGVSYSYYLMFASVIAPPAKTSLSISLVNAAAYAGIFVGPYVCPLIQSFTGAVSMAECMPWLVVISIVYAALSVIFVIRERRLSKSMAA